MIRIESEKLEKLILSPFASYSSESKGRKIFEEKCDIRTEYQRDRDRVLHSKAFRRLKHKTQVFIAPAGDHYRTRLTHTLEVAQIGRTITRTLRLNEDLVEAIALAHDLGHTPFGHKGEEVLNKLHPKGFKHSKQSLKVVDFLESSPKRRGLNLTFEVRDGLLHHTGDDRAETLEGQIIKFADRIAYINHDIDDAIRAKIITQNDLPEDLINILGQTHSMRINTMINSIINESLNKNYVKMDDTVGKATMELRQFMFENVYFNKIAKSEDEKIEYILEEIFKYYKKHNDKIPREHLNLYKDQDYIEEDIITDYIAGMTDRYVINLWRELTIPKAWVLG